MKFTVSMKDPDTLHDAIEEAVIRDLATNEGLSDDEKDAIMELRIKDIYKGCATWFRYGEYLTVEIDTEAGTCTVLPDE